MKLLGSVLLLSLILKCVVAPPVKENQQQEENHIDGNQQQQQQQPPDDFDLEYGRYLKQVVQALEADESFRDKLQNATEDDIKSGLIAHELEFVKHNVRTKLDEIKRQEVDRIRQAAREQLELSQGFDRKQIKVPKHLDHRNQHTFEIEDLKRLILQTTRDLEETDRKRKKEFKEYEMEKERARVDKLKALDEEHRKQAEQEFEEQMKKHKEHPKLHHPGSKQQLEEVWEKQDHLPANEFNPKMFFKMHDLDGDGQWSIEEVNALFQNELNKMYDPNAPEDDIQERYEEMERMREHVFKESDANKDGLISYDEFMQQAKKQEFEQDQGWEGLDEQQIYTKDEYEQYERQRREEMARMSAAGINPYNAPYGGVPVQPGYAPQQGNPNYGGYQQLPPQHYPQQGYPPQHAQQGNQGHGYQQGMHAPYMAEQQNQFQGYAPPQQHVPSHDARGSPQQHQTPPQHHQQPPQQQQYQQPPQPPQQQQQQPTQPPQQQQQQPTQPPQQQQKQDAQSANEVPSSSANNPPPVPKQPEQPVKN